MPDIPIDGMSTTTVSREHSTASDKRRSHSDHSSLVQATEVVSTQRLSLKSPGAAVRFADEAMNGNVESPSQPPESIV